MENLNLDKIPFALRQKHQWVLWRMVGEDNRKMPFNRNGAAAKANDPATWGSFAEIAQRFERGGFEGPGFEFDKDDPFCGVDLDGCRDPASGKVDDWAREVIARVDTYAEVSPSKTGVKLFCIGQWPATAHKAMLDQPAWHDKAPAIEVYDRGRYFAVTGWRLNGPHEPQSRQEQLDWLRAKYFTSEAPKAAPGPLAGDDEIHVIERARKYLLKIPPAVAGQGGHNTTFTAACTLIVGFALRADQAYPLLAEWNQTCQPPWNEKDLRHKLSEAEKQPEERGYLRNMPPQRLQSCKVQRFVAPKPKPEPKVTTLRQAAEKYLESVRTGKASLIETGISDLDYALGGGLEKAEMMIIAARPSHGKSAVGLQLAHNWTAQRMPVLFVSEEMSPLALGKRTVQFASGVDQERWHSSTLDVASDLHQHFDGRAECYIAETCRSATAVEDIVRRHVADHGVRAIIVDYTQLLQGMGKSRYEQIGDVSVTLRRLANETSAVLVALCQLNREIEKRDKFVPRASDLRDAGQLEQDADVIVFGVWPHRIDQRRPANEYKFYVAKNRNRAIMQHVVESRFDPSRQMIQVPKPQDRENYEPAFDAFG